MAKTDYLASLKGVRLKMLRDYKTVAALQDTYESLTKALDVGTSVGGEGTLVKSQTDTLKTRVTAVNMGIVDLCALHAIDLVEEKKVTEE